MSKSKSLFDAARLGLRRTRAEAEGFWPERERRDHQIRNTLLGSTDSDEYIEKLDIPEGAPLASEDSVPNEGSKGPKRKLSTVNAAVNDTEWTMLRMLSAVGGGVDLEMWWRRSNINNRITAIVTTILFLIALCNFVLGIILIVQALKANASEPHVCRTASCINASIQIKEFMKNSVSPCDNFYEFMCGRYKERGEEGDLFGELITRPTVAVELGSINILGKILKWNESNKDQHITFYQSCLNHYTRQKYGLAALQESVYHWFGTKDFKSFSTQKSMEEIAAAIFTDVGHASYINMAFYTYPYILILEPHPYTMDYRFSKDDRNKEFLETLFENLMLHLDLLSNDTISREIIEDMVNGTDVMSTVVYELLSGVKKLKNIPKDASVDNLPSGIGDIVNGKLAGLCPPMGIQLDYFKVLELFLEEDDYKVAYLSQIVHKYVLGLQACFKKDPGQFTKHSFKHPKTAFVAVWIADIFLYDFILGADYKTISKRWKFKGIGEDHELVNMLSRVERLNDEYACLDMLWTALGHIPTIRFLESEPGGEANQDIQRFNTWWANSYYPSLPQMFFKIPKSEMDWRLNRLAQTTFEKGLYSELGFSLVGGIVDYKIGMELKFTEDFLNNTLIGFKYTIARARHNWLGSTDPHPNMKYFGSGGPGNIKRDLFVPRYLRVDSARLVEKESAAKNQEYETFLGRKPYHYIRFPVTLFDEKQLDILPLQHDFTVSITMGLLSLLNDVYSEEKYPSLTWEELVGESENMSNQSISNTSCGLFEVTLNSTNASRLNPSVVASNISHYSWNNRKLFLAVVTAKIAYFSYRYERRYVNEDIKFSFTETERRKHYKRYSRLGDGLENYSEAQLFFMGYARNVCRESWKLDKHTEEERQKHYSLEATVLTTLMQMEEFSLAFKCKEKSMMNNMGEPRCINWIPDKKLYIY